MTPNEWWIAGGAVLLAIFGMNQGGGGPVAGVVDKLSLWLKGLRPWITIMPWEKAVRVRAGKWTKVMSSGIRFKFPYLDDYIVVNTRLRISPSATQTVSTLDGKPVTIVAYVGFRITDPLKAMLRLQWPENSCSAFAATAIASYISSHTVSDLDVLKLQEAVTKELRVFSQDGFEFDFVTVVDFVIVKTYRLLNSNGHAVGQVWGAAATAQGPGVSSF